ncbi:MAG: NADH-quinone oxidoreductase subunit J [Gemmataceae bacterium]
MLFLVPLILGAVAVYLLLPQPRGYPPLLGAGLAGLALVLAGGFWARGASWSPETVLFYSFAAMAVIAGGLLITQSQPARAALSFALVVLSTTGLFLLQAAPFLMAATIIVYAGAIIVTFLFVIMLAQQEGLSNADQRSREPLLATVGGFLLLGLLAWTILWNYDRQRNRADAPTLLQLAERSQHAALQSSFEDIEQSLGDMDTFLDDYRRHVEPNDVPLPDETPATDARAALHQLKEHNLAVAFEHVRQNWLDWKETHDTPAMRTALRDLAAATFQLTSVPGNVPPASQVALSPFSVPPPGSTQNVAPLGRTLFTDYLVAFELAGLLLTVATIGTIAITTRQRERQP